MSINIFDTSKNIFNMSANIFDISTDISKYPRVLGFTLTSSIVLQMRILPIVIFSRISVDIYGYPQISTDIQC